MTLFEPGQIVELRCPNYKRGTASGYFSDMLLLWNAAKELSGKVPGVYVTLNPVNPALLARANNRVELYAKTTTADADILSRRWLPIDLDAARPAGISSTEEEHQAAIERADEIRVHLAAQGWPLPILADSGNGAHLLYRIDLPNDKTAAQTVQDCLKALSAQFGDLAVDVDTTTYNAARIWKCYGTLACKGDNTEERPHRKAKILNAPDEVHAVPPELLLALADSLPPPPARPAPGNGPAFDLPSWIVEHRLSVASEGKWDGSGHKWILSPCPWNAEHTNRAAFIFQFANGAIAAGCRHDGCAGHDWASLRKLMEPDWEPYDPDRRLDRLPPPALSQTKPPPPDDSPGKTSRITPADIMTPKDLGQAYTDFIKSLNTSRINLGWTELDDVLRGITPGEVLTLWAQTGAGKTAWLQNMLRNVAYYRRIVSLFCSMEQPEHQCLERYAQMITGLTGSQIEHQWQNEGRREELIREICEDLGENTLTCPTPGLSLEEIEELVSMAEQKAGKPVNLLAIDYAGLMDGRGLDNTLYGQRSQLAREIKNLAKRRRLGIVQLVQVNRGAGADASTPLTLHSGRDTGAIEEASDFVLGLYRPDLLTDDRRIAIQVLKNRKGRANVEFLYSFNHSSLEIGRTELSGVQMERVPTNGKTEDMI